jgi:hypothetical protein
MAYRFQVGDLVETEQIFRDKKQIGVVVERTAYMDNDRETPQRAYIICVQNLLEESCPEVMFYEHELCLLCPID